MLRLDIYKRFTTKGLDDDDQIFFHKIRVGIGETLHKIISAETIIFDKTTKALSYHRDTLLNLYDKSQVDSKFANGVNVSLYPAQ